MLSHPDEIYLSGELLSAQLPFDATILIISYKDILSQSVTLVRQSSWIVRLIDDASHAAIRDSPQLYLVSQRAFVGKAAFYSEKS